MNLFFDENDCCYQEMIPFEVTGRYRNRKYMPFT